MTNTRGKYFSPRASPGRDNSERKFTHHRQSAIGSDIPHVVPSRPGLVHHFALSRVRVLCRVLVVLFFSSALPSLPASCSVQLWPRMPRPGQSAERNLLNRDNQRVQITQDGFITNSAQFVQTSKIIGINIFPAQYRTPTSFLRATDAYAPRQIQLALKLIF